MQRQMTDLGYENVFIGTVEGEPEDTSCESVIEKVKARQAQGKQFSIIVVAEGSKPVGGKMTVARLVKNSFE